MPDTEPERPDRPTIDQQVNAGGDLIGEVADDVNDPGGAHAKGYSADPPGAAVPTGVQTIPLQPDGAEKGGGRR